MGVSQVDEGLVSSLPFRRADHGLNCGWIMLSRFSFHAMRFSDGQINALKGEGLFEACWPTRCYQLLDFLFLQLLFRPGVVSF